MQPAKSLRKLRSATTAYLEDGGAMIHSIDTLLRDLNHSIDELDVREQAIVERESRLAERESKLELLASRVDTALQQLLSQSIEPSTAVSSSNLSTDDRLSSLSSPEEHSPSCDAELPMKSEIKPDLSSARSKQRRNKSHRRPLR